jgi:hypothetical protein
MTSRRFDLWHKAVALAPVLLLLVYVPGETLLRCRIDGLLRSTCCCSHEDEKPSSGPIVKAQDCCDPEVSASERPTAEAAPPTTHELAALVAAALPVASIGFVAAPTEQLGRAAQRHGPVREGPALVLLKHSFLI